MNFRPERVGKLIQHELNTLMARELEFNGALPTITRVEVDKKLEHAAIYVSIIPEAAAEKTFAVLKDAQGDLQHRLMKRLPIKPLPRIAFVLDHGMEHAADVEKIFLKEDNNGTAQ